ncbi:DNA methyltransferase [Terrabacter carboxydivorans]|uniref:site-specific DNA-methyltransferase (adenine-specific) n=1 Tax=Terrabacter carboxydivorans TaxID=619730 RepID=A0ABP5XYB5_9MICO
MGRVLSSAERRLLEGVVVEAREVVEAACASRVELLGVGAERVPEVLSESDRVLRRGLRARARQLGSVEALVAEAGFEHWHRMLFARFLADNELLVDDIAGQPVSVDELAEVAAELGEPDQWEVAARFASAMLPGIFRMDDPVLAMRLPVETRQRLEDLLGSLPAEVLRADDALGWVYQYWQSRRKDEVNRSERKIGGADLSPVTQLFTEDYMVRFLLENSLGAWWAARHPESPLVSGWEFLRVTDEGTPAAGSFEEWPQRTAEVTVMDPCCGSGHFLVAAFGMLWRMRAEEEGLDPVAAQDAVLRENLFGLELDPRCTQIAAFALALEAWKSGGYRVLPVPQVACSGIPARAPLSEWTVLANGDERVEAALARLHSLFVNADTLGSLIDPVRAAEDAGLESVDWHQVAPLVGQALTAEAGKHGDDPAAAVFGEAAAGIARAADYLSGDFTLVATNPPYLGLGRQSPSLASYLLQHLPHSKNDLATAILERWSGNRASQTAVLVSPQTPLFLKSYRTFRQDLVENLSIHLVARLGAGAFQAISGEVVQSALLILSRGQDREIHSLYLDLSSTKGPDGKAQSLVSEPFSTSRQAKIRSVPNFVLAPVADAGHPLLAAYVEAHYGSKPGQTTRVRREFWELPGISLPWQRLESGPDGEHLFSGKRQIILAPKEAWARGVHEFGIRGSHAWGKKGVIVARMSDLPAGIYCGEIFDDNSYALIPRDSNHLPAVLEFLTSSEYVSEVRQRNQKLGVDTDSMVNIPFDIERWQSVAAREYPKGVPEPFSPDATQWLFKGQPVGSDQPLHVAVARLLGFSWPDQVPDMLDGLADDDGVVCLPPVGGELPAADRLLGLLSAAWGHEWSPAVLDQLLTQVGARAGRAGLEAWLRNGFFKDHIKVFGNRPFIWQVWDGTPDGFSALVNYHRLDRRLLERLTYDYLGSWWMGRVRDDVAREVPGAAKRLAAAEDLQRKLRLILEGEPPYDIFVRWKDLAEQPIGWDPDLDDGVRLNIRPFMTADILRVKPNIKWTKDRGKNPDGSERLNDLHYTTDEKHTARGATA